jgi:hypothetical protein
MYMYIPAYYVCQYMRVHYICPLEPSIKFSRSGLSQRIAEGQYIGRGSSSPEVVLFGYNIPSREKYDRERQRGAYPGGYKEMSSISATNCVLAYEPKYGGRGGVARSQHQSTYFTVRGQSYFSRLPKYWLPIPLSARRVCPPPATPIFNLWAYPGPLSWRTHRIFAWGGGFWYVTVAAS